MNSEIRFVYEPKEQTNTDTKEVIDWCWSEGLKTWVFLLYNHDKQKYEKQNLEDLPKVIINDLDDQYELNEDLNDLSN